MTGYKLKSFADLSAWSDDLVEERLQDTAHALARYGVPQEQIDREVAYLREQLTEARAEFMRSAGNINERSGAPLH